MKRLPWIVASLGLLASIPAVQAENTWDYSLDLRYRFEQVDDDRFSQDAEASTTRIRLSLLSPEWSGWQFGASAHANRHIGSEHFNSTANGRTTYPVVADPDDEGLSQAWIGYRRDKQLDLRIGRQRLLEDNVRFLGNVGFRQLEQTFDAATVRWQPASGWQLDLRWIDRAHRIFGRSNPNDLLAEADLNTWMGTLSRSLDAATVAIYAHRIAYDDRAASHRNLGFKVTGQLPVDNGIGYRVELARQDGVRELSDVDGQNYLHLRLEQKLDSWRWFAGHERLEGDGDYSFQTPLATLHAHNGWTDQFLSTPADGLVDSYAGAGLGAGEWSGLIKLHHFESDRDSRRYGNEYGLMIKRALPADLSLEAKWAQFDGRGSRADVAKLWLTLAGSW